MTDLLLAILHHLAIATLIVLLGVEFILFNRPVTSPEDLRLLGRIDAMYGGSAFVVLGIGVARVVYGAKGTEYFVSNPWFWSKMTAFAIVALLSLPPTIALLRWRKIANGQPGFIPTNDQLEPIRRFVAFEFVALAAVLVCAAAMARYGTF